MLGQLSQGEKMKALAFETKFFHAHLLQSFFGGCSISLTYAGSGSVGIMKYSITEKYFFKIKNINYWFIIKLNLYKMRLALQKILYTNVSQLFLSVHLVDESADDFVVFLNEIDLEREIAILLLDYGNSQSNYQYLFMIYCL